MFEKFKKNRQIRALNREMTAIEKMANPYRALDALQEWPDKKLAPLSPSANKDMQARAAAIMHRARQADGPHGVRTFRTLKSNIGSSGFSEAAHQFMMERVADDTEDVLNLAALALHQKKFWASTWVECFDAAFSKNPALTLDNIPYAFYPLALRQTLPNLSAARSLLDLVTKGAAAATPSTKMAAIGAAGKIFETSASVPEQEDEFLFAGRWGESIQKQAEEIITAGLHAYDPSIKDRALAAAECALMAACPAQCQAELSSPMVDELVLPPTRKLMAEFFAVVKDRDVHSPWLGRTVAMLAHFACAARQLSDSLQDFEGLNATWAQANRSTYNSIYRQPSNDGTLDDDSISDLELDTVADAHPAPG